MPRGVVFESEANIVSFRNTIISSLPVKLHKRSDFIELCDLVARKTGVVLSESTLRRLMDPRNRIAPTYTTLDAVARTIGFSSWEDFCKKNEFEVQHMYLQELIVQEHQRTTDFESFKKIIDKFKFTSVAFEVYSKMVFIALEDKNIVVLSRIFDFPHIFTHQENDLPLHFFITSLVRKLLEEELMDQLIHFYATSKFAQIYFIEYFVDEYNLNGYYGKMLELYHQQKHSPEDLLFYHGLMCERALISNLDYGEHLKELQSFKDSKYYHFFPRGRRFALLMMLMEEKQEQKNLYFLELENLFLELPNDYLKIKLSHFLCRIFFIRKDYKLIKFALDFSKNHEIRHADLLTLIDKNELKKYEAFVYTRENKLQQAISLINEYDPRLIDYLIVSTSLQHLNEIKSLIGI